MVFLWNIQLNEVKKDYGTSYAYFSLVTNLQNKIRNILYILKEGGRFWLVWDMYTDENATSALSTRKLMFKYHNTWVTKLTGKTNSTERYIAWRIY